MAATTVCGAEKEKIPSTAALVMTGSAATRATTLYSKAVTGTTGLKVGRGFDSLLSGGDGNDRLSARDRVPGETVDGGEGIDRCRADVGDSPATSDNVVITSCED